MDSQIKWADANGKGQAFWAKSDDGYTLSAFFNAAFAKWRWAVSAHRGFANVEYGNGNADSLETAKAAAFGCLLAVRERATPEKAVSLAQEANETASKLGTRLDIAETQMASAIEAMTAVAQRMDSEEEGRRMLGVSIDALALHIEELDKAAARLFQNLGAIAERIERLESDIRELAQFREGILAERSTADIVMQMSETVPEPVATSGYVAEIEEPLLEEPTVGEGPQLTFPSTEIPAPLPAGIRKKLRRRR